MKFLTKHLLTIFTIGNLMAVYRMLRPFSDVVFYASLAIGVLMVLMNIGNVFSRQTITKYKVFFFFILVMWIYQFIFGMDKIYPKTWTYLVSKTVMLLMTIAVIERHPQYYLKTYYIIISYIAAVLLVIGFFLFPFTPDGRMGLGFANPNTTGGLSAICFCFLYLSENNNVPKWHKRILLLIFAFAVLASGSRASLGLLVLAFIYKHGLSGKLITTGALILITVFFVLPHFGLAFQGIDRFIDTINSQEFSAGREDVREAAWVMINNSPIEGNGIYCSQSEEAMLISDLGSHNAYLDFLKWFGYPLGGLLIASLFWCAYQLLRIFWKSSNFCFRAHLLVVWGVLGMCFFEGLIWGVNEINNTLFFASFAILEFYKSNEASQPIMQ